MKHDCAWSIGIASTTLALCGALARPAGAAVFNVNSVADVPDALPGDRICSTGGLCNGVPCCTLRAAVMEANTIVFDVVTINLPAGTYLLTRPIAAPDGDSNGDLDILNENVKIVGAGRDLTIIDANHLDRVFHPNTSVLTLYDLRIQGGRPPDVGSRSGGTNGGGILGKNSVISLVRCLVRDNAVPTAQSGGGGIFVDGGSLDLTDSVVRINNASPGYGGGIYGSFAEISMSRSTVNSNSATYGGGIEAASGTLAISNSTISGNVATDSGGGLLLSYVSDAKLNNVTIAANTAGGAYPAGSDVAFEASSATLSNSILQAEDPLCAVATITSNGHNFVGSLGSCSITGAFLDAFYELNLGTLGFYGGSTATHSLLAGSVALDAGSPATADNPFGCYDTQGAPLATDQRGVTRRIGSACDLGAFEVEPIGDANGDGTVSVADVFWLINYLFAAGPAPLGRANVNGGNGAIDVADVFYLVNYLFAGGQPPSGAQP